MKKIINFTGNKIAEKRYRELADKAPNSGFCQLDLSLPIDNSTFLMTVRNPVSNLGVAIALLTGSLLSISPADAGVLTVDGDITNGVNTLTVAGVGGTTISGVVGIDGGAGGLTKTDAGVLTLSGLNLYQGATAINGGTVSISAASVGSRAPMPRRRVVH